MKYKHYAPKAEMTIFEAAGTGDNACATRETVRNEMLREAARLESEGKKVKVFDLDDEETAAKEFFAGLRSADEEGVDNILVMALPEEGIGFAVMNRMLKAAGYNVRRVDGAAANRTGGSMIIALAADQNSTKKE